MKIFANKNIWKKLVIALIFITLVGFMVPKPVAAGLGGKLMEPVCDLLVGLCDGIINVIHTIVLKQDVTLIKVDLLTDGQTIIRFIATLFMAALIAVVLWNVVGAGIGLFTALGEGSLGTLTAGVTIKEAFELLVLRGLEKSAVGIAAIAIAGGGIVGVSTFKSDYFDNNIYIPLYSISPEEIFKAEIPLFNVNFFNPESGTIPYDWLGEYDFKQDSEGNPLKFDENFCSPNANATQSPIFKEINEKLQKENIDLNVSTIMNSQWSHKYTESTTDQTIWYYIIKEGNGAGTYKLIANVERASTAGEVSSYKYTLWRTNQIAKSYSEGGEIYSLSYELKGVIEKWYYILFTIAVVGMMSVLVYIGIRILLTSTAPQKAKYKQMLGDWGIGMVLLFTMTFIMVLANFFVDKLTNIFNSIQPRLYYQFLEEDSGGKIEKTLRNYGFEITTEGEEPDDYQTVLKYTTESAKDSEGKKVTVFQMRSANLMGQMRYYTHYNRNSESYVGYTILFFVMTIYLIMFVWTYLRRVLYMAFLTIISPLVALTYPIDKATDGQAQGFNLWFKEYAFNLLIQPLHLLLYTILITSAGKFATENMLYAIVVIGFMTPAEKLLRKLFNFQKAETPGLFSGFAGGAVVMSGMRWLMGRGPKGGSGDARDKGEKEKIEDYKDPKSGMNFAAIEEDNNIPNLNTSKDNNSIAVNDSKGGKSPADYSGYSDSALRFAMKHLSKNEGNLSESDQDKLNRMREELAKRQKNQMQTNNTKVDTSEIKSNTAKTSDETKGYSYGRAMKNYLDAYGSNMRNRAKARLKRANPAKFVGKWAMRGAGAATLGMIGLAAGVSSGNPANAAKYAGAGVVGGAKLGGNTYDSMERKLNPGNAGEEALRAYLGEERYQKMMNDKRLREAQANEEYIRKVEKQFKVDRIDAKAKLAEMTNAYYEMGETDFDKIIEYEKAYDKVFKHEKADEKTRREDRARAAITGKIVEQFGLTSQLEDDKWKKRQQRAEELYKDKLSKGQINKIFNTYAQDYIRVKESMKG